MQLNLSHNEMMSCKKSGSLPLLSYLDLSFNPELSDLKGFPELPELKELYLDSIGYFFH